MAISVRCGTMQSVLLEAGGNESVYIGLIVELLILAAFIAGLWALLWLLGRANLNRTNTTADLDIPAFSLVNSLTAAITQTVATAVFLMFLCQSEAKNQALASVGIASFLAHSSPTNMPGTAQLLVLVGSPDRRRNRLCVGGHGTGHRPGHRQSHRHIRSPRPPVAPGLRQRRSCRRDARLLDDEEKGSRQ